MSKLNAAERNALPTKDFAVSGRKYPIEDKGHAKAALSRSAHKGGSIAKTVKAAVKRKFPGMHIKPTTMGALY